MNELLKKVKPADVIAIMVIIGGLILKLSGCDGIIDTLLISVAATYFGGNIILNKINSKVSTTDETTMTTETNNTTNETIEQTIRRIATEMGVNQDLAYRVAKAESGLRQYVYNENTNGSIDRGVFQWNSKYHPEVSDDCAYNIECATKKFCEAVKSGNLSWWNASKAKCDV